VPDDRPTGPPDAISVTGFSTERGGKRERTVDPSRAEPDISPDSGPLSTDLGGQVVDNAEDDTAQGDLVHAALDNARRLGRGPGRRRRRDPDGARRTRRENLLGRNRGGYSAPGPDRSRDPQPIGPLLGECVTELGWQRPLTEARVFADWPSLVGPDVAAHCGPQSLQAGELRIAAESTAWATQLRLLAGTLLARLVAELGPDVVSKLIITGPTGPSWKHGGRSIRGARGPRDTYG
jgi:predicted nucleic acid-binding Zn ribbon protein